MWGASSKLGVDPHVHTFDQFVRRLSLKNRLIDDAKERALKAPSTLK